MSFIRTKLPLRLLSRCAAVRPLSAAPSPASPSSKLDRIADDLLSLTPAERHDYSILFGLKLGIPQWGPAGGVPVASAGGTPAEGAAPAEEVKEKTAFDVKLEKFEAASKIKVIKEVRAFTSLGLKEAKELVEKAPVVIKQGVTKEEAEQIVAKLKEAGATVAME